MNNLHHTIEDSRLNIARHELAHAWLAHELGFFVEDITLDTHADRHAGRTHIAYPMGADTFDEQYAKSPLQAAAWAVQILAVIRSGAYCEIHGGQIGGEPRGQDLDHIQAWREGLLPIYGNHGWLKVYAESYRGLRAWYNFPSVRAVFREAAPVLASQVRVGRYQLLSLFEVTGAETCPPPRFAPILPLARRQPAPERAPAFSGSVRRRVELQAVPTAIQDADDDDERPVFSNTVALREDAERRYFVLAGQGDYSLYRFEKKITGCSTFVVAKEHGHDRQGNPRLSSWEFATETAARLQMTRMASR